MLLSTLLALVASAAPLEPPPLPGAPLDGWEALVPPAAMDPLTAGEAVQIALERNGDLRAQLSEVDRARGARLTARALPNPTAELELWGEGEFQLHGFEAEYALSDALLTTLRARPADRAVDRARLEASAEVVRLGFEVREALYAAVATEQRYSATMQAVDAWAAGVETARALFAAGNVAELDLAVQEAEYERSRIGLAAVEMEVVTSRERLSRLLGGEVRRPLAALASASAVDVPEDVEDRAVAASLELAAMDASVAAAGAALTSARVDALLPDFGVYVGSGRFGGAWDIDAGVHVSVPLFDLGRGEIVARGAERSAQRSMRAQREVDVRSAARQARARLVSAHDRAAHFEAVVLPARERVSRQTMLQYNAMQVGIYALLEARRQELEARAAHAELLAESSTAQAALDALLAGVRVDAPAPTRSAPRAASPAGGH